MINIPDNIRKNRYFILFILIFAYAQSVHSRILIRNELNFYTFTPDAAISIVITASILFLVINYFIRLWQKSEAFSMQEMLKIFGFSLLTYLVIVQLMGLVISILFGNLERNFNSETFIQSTFTYLLDGFIYGGFFLVFYYYKKDKKHRAQLTEYNKALYESRLSLLKSQLNPHFLFNNLNVLDQLIYEDKYKASAFLNEFSGIYRYVLESSNRSFVSIKDELSFAEQYFRLIKHRYGNSYFLTVKPHNTEGCIIPLTLQLLIENSVKHNLGTEEKPVFIEISLDEHIDVSNNRIPKRTVAAESGKALKNLNEQYMILTNKQVEIYAGDDRFSIRVPKIHVQ